MDFSLRRPPALLVLLVCFVLGMGIAAVGCVEPAPALPPVAQIRIHVEDHSTAAMLRRVALSVPEVFSEGESTGSAAAVACRQTGAGIFEVTLLTAKHVGERPNLTLNFAELGTTGTVTEVVPYDGDDIALIRAAVGAEVPPIPLADSFEIGAKAFKLGWAGDHSILWLSEGLQSAKNTSTAPSAFGDSGGAVVDEAGHLLGVCQGIEAWQRGFAPMPSFIWHHSFFVPVADVRQWLEPLMPK